METQIIVIAWTENTKLVPTGRTITRDMNLFPEFAVAPEGKAVIWMNKGTEADLAKAKAYAAQEGGGRTVFTFPRGERDPLGKARAAVLS